MKTSSAIRYSCLICFIFALLCTIPNMGILVGVFAFTAVIWTACSVLAARSKSPVLRILLAILSTSIVVLVFWKKIVLHPLPCIAFAAVSVLFTVLMGIGRFDVEYWKFRRSFIAMASVSIFASILNVLIYIAVDPHVKEAMNLEAILAFTMACALLGVFVLSELRKGDADTKWKAMTAGRITAILSLSCAALVLLFLILSFGFSLIKPILGPMANRPKNDYIVYDSHTIPYSVTIVNPDKEDSAKDAMQEEENYGEQQREEEQILPWWVIAICIAILLAVVAVLLVLHIRKKRLLAQTGENDGKEQSQDLPDEVMQIRETYRQYIAFVQRNAGELSKGSTSEDIMESSDLPEDAGELERSLREIYIKARYGKPEDVTAEDAAKAKELYNAILAKAEEAEDRS